jgi:hypothetical protein
MEVWLVSEAQQDGWVSNEYLALIRKKNGE